MVSLKSLMLLLLTLKAPLDSTKPSIADVWRDGQHSGSNAVWCFLRIHNEEVDAAEFSAVEHHIGPPQNVADILAFARQLGWAMEARSISPEDLDAMPLPAIVQLDGDKRGAGYFLVLLQVQRSRCVCMEGASASIITMDWESFLRRWSGVVVIRSDSSFWKVKPMIAVGLLAGFAVSVLLIRGNNKWKLSKYAA